MDFFLFYLIIKKMLSLIYINFLLVISFGFDLISSGPDFIPTTPLPPRFTREDFWKMVYTVHFLYWIILPIILIILLVPRRYHELFDKHREPKQWGRKKLSFKLQRWWRSKNDDAWNKWMNENLDIVLGPDQNFIMFPDGLEEKNRLAEAKHNIYFLKLQNRFRWYASTGKIIVYTPPKKVPLGFRLVKWALKFNRSSDAFITYYVIFIALGILKAKLSKMGLIGFINYFFLMSYCI
jgi:hypothetical protein